MPPVPAEVGKNISSVAVNKMAKQFVKEIKIISSTQFSIKKLYDSVFIFVLLVFIYLMNYSFP